MDEPARKPHFTPILSEESNVCCIGNKSDFVNQFSCKVTYLQALNLRDVMTEFDFVFGVVEQPYTSTILKHIQRILKPGGKLFLHIISGESAYQSLLFSGFTDIQSSDTDTEARGPTFGPSIRSTTLIHEPRSRDSISLFKPFQGLTLMFCGTKPAYSISPVSLSAKLPGAEVWKITTQDDNPFATQDDNPFATQDDNPVAMQEDNPFATNDDADDVVMLDMDDLLANESFPVQIKDTQIDCGTGSERKKACKNCSCGLKEILDGENGVAPGEEPPKSACGSCHLGDAFRCAACPYLGKPAFQPGDVVKLTQQ